MNKGPPTNSEKKKNIWKHNCEINRLKGMAKVVADASLPSS